jgi:hypothetical protein
MKPTLGGLASTGMFKQLAPVAVSLLQQRRLCWTAVSARAETLHRRMEGALQHGLRRGMRG